VWSTAAGAFIALFVAGVAIVVAKNGSGTTSSTDSTAAAAAVPADCGIGTYACVGEQQAGTTGFVNITAMDGVKAISPAGWWQTTIFAGYSGGTSQYGFKEVEYCTKIPAASNRLQMQPGDTLLCVTGSRSDQVNPTVGIQYTQNTCDKFTKVITAGPATAGGGEAPPSLSRVTCHRVNRETKDLPAGLTHKSIGSVLTSTYGQFNDKPLTTAAAMKANWTALNNGACDSSIGIIYQYQQRLDPASPIQLHYTASGQFAGMSVFVYGNMWPELVAGGWWRREADLTLGSQIGASDLKNKTLPSNITAGSSLAVHKLTISTRAVAAMCDPLQYSGVDDIGDRLVVNQGQSQGTIEIPITLKPYPVDGTSTAPASPAWGYIPATA